MHLSIVCSGEIIAVMQKKEQSLRERRREQTWTAIHEAALKRVRDHGMRGTTVEEIAQEAGVSPRTFFNYFPSKEDAVLGLREPVVSEEILETDRAHEDDNTIIRVTHLLWEVIFQSFHYANGKDPRAPFQEFPESAKRMKMHYMKCEQVLTDYLNTIDWVAFDAAGRRGPFPRRTPADPLAAIQLAKHKGALVLGICNVVGSSISRQTNAGVYTHAGPEIGVASTKAFTAQVTVLAMLASLLGYKRGHLSEEQHHEFICGLLEVPDKVEHILQSSDLIKQVAQQYYQATNFLFLGRGYMFPVALEGALKLKEISYIHAEGYPAAEIKHGPIALIDEYMPVVILAPRDRSYEKVVSNIQEVKARHGKVIAIVTEGDTVVRELADYCIEIPQSLPAVAALLAVAALGTSAAATWTATGVGLVGYVINTTLPMNPDLADWARISPFHWYGATNPLENGADWGNVAILLVGSAVLLAASFPLFTKRDLRV